MTFFFVFFCFFLFFVLFVFCLHDCDRGLPWRVPYELLRCAHHSSSIIISDHHSSTRHPASSVPTPSPCGYSVHQSVHQRLASVLSATSQSRSLVRIAMIVTDIIDQTLVAPRKAFAPGTSGRIARIATVPTSQTRIAPRKAFAPRTSGRIALIATVTIGQTRRPILEQFWWIFG